MFSCVSDAVGWMENNCHRCKKYDRDSAADTECEFGNKLSMGFLMEWPTKSEGEPYNCNGDPSTICSQIDLRD